MNTQNELSLEYVKEKAKLLSVRSAWDVIIAGGGLGGIAAAIAAARTGAKTLLVERNTYPGGVATAGMCCSIFNCFYTSEHKPGSQGIPMEIADRLAAAMGYGMKWHVHKGHIIYDLELGKLVLQEMLEQSGVELLLGVTVDNAIVEQNVLKGVIVNSKSGREVLLAKTVVDATGDADVAYLAGVPLHMPETMNWCSKHSLCFRLGNVNIDSFIDYFRLNPDEYPAMMDVDWTLDEALKQYDECGTFLFPHGGGIQMKAFQQAIRDNALPEKVGIHDTTNACQMHGMRQTGIVHVITGFATFNGLDARLISRAINNGRQMAFTVAEVYRRYIPGFEKAFVAGVADNLGVRSSRWLAGDFVFTAEMMSSGTRFDDAVGRLIPYQNTIKHPGANAWSVQVMGKDTFDLPYRCLLPKKIDGLIMGAGRSISATTPWMLRVMVHTMTIGQAAGVAAAISALNGKSLRDTAISKIQSALQKLNAL